MCHAPFFAKIEKAIDSNTLVERDSFEKLGLICGKFAGTESLLSDFTIKTLQHPKRKLFTNK